MFSLRVSLSRTCYYVAEESKNLFIRRFGIRDGIGTVLRYSQNAPKRTENSRRIFKVALTGGPCGGKTTGQVRLSTFFENIGWKVYNVPEMATVVLKGGIQIKDLTPAQNLSFQQNMIRLMMRTEDLYEHLAHKETEKDVLIICDRGTMDNAAYIDKNSWNLILRDNNWNPVALRDNRYDQVIHMVSAAVGATEFYTLANNASRTENPALAAELDMKTRESWVGHPCVDIIDNARSFEEKLLHMIQIVCDRIGIEKLQPIAGVSRKRKFLVSDVSLQEFPKFEEFEVVHDYLIADHKEQVRLRKRGQNDTFNYSYMLRQRIDGKQVERRMQITNLEYEELLALRNPDRTSSRKKRRCFIYGEHYFHLDIFQSPLPRGHESLMILETYTRENASCNLPPFLKVEREVTDDQSYSTRHLCKK